MIRTIRNASTTLGALLFLAVAHVQVALASSLGPDAFGYTATMTAFDLRDIRETGTPLVLLDDQVAGALPIGFSFHFYGTDYTQFYVSSNGFIAFDNPNGDSDSSSRPLPTNDNLNVLAIAALFWTDLNPEAGGSVLFETRGSPGSRELIVGFYEVPDFNEFLFTDVVAEAIFSEGTNNILFQFGDIDLLSTSFDDSVSIGIQNTAQDIALQIHFEEVADREFFNEAYLITPEPSSFILFSLGLVALVVAAATRRRSSTN